MTYQKKLGIHLYSMFLGKKKTLKVYEIIKSNSIINTKTERKLALGKKTQQIK